MFLKQFNLHNSTSRNILFFKSVIRWITLLVKTLLMVTSCWMGTKHVYMHLEKRKQQTNKQNTQHTTDLKYVKCQSILKGENACSWEDRTFTISN